MRICKTGYAISIILPFYPNLPENPEGVTKKSQPTL